MLWLSFAMEDELQMISQLLSVKDLCCSKDLWNILNFWNLDPVDFGLAFSNSFRVVLVILDLFVILDSIFSMVAIYSLHPTIVGVWHTAELKEFCFQMESKHTILWSVSKTVRVSFLAEVQKALAPLGLIADLFWGRLQFIHPHLLVWLVEVFTLENVSHFEIVRVHQID